MANPFRILLRLTVLLRPAMLVLLLALYVTPLVSHGCRTTWSRGPLAAAADGRRQAALRRAGYAGFAPPVYFQAGLFAPLKWLGSDACYIALTESQIRLIDESAAGGRRR